MANWYVNPGLGSGTNAGTSWANAFDNTATAWADAISASSAGDDFYVNGASTCSNTTAQTLTFKGTFASPNRIFSCSTITNNPPQTADLSATPGAAFVTTGASAINLAGSFYMYGCKITAGDSSNGANIFFAQAAAAADQFLDNCALKHGGTGTSSVIIIGTGTANVGQRVTWNNTTVQFGNAAASVSLGGATFKWMNTASAIQGATLPTDLFGGLANNRGILSIVDGVDLSALSAKTGIIAGNGPGVYQFVNCRLPASFTTAATPLAAGSAVVDYVGCDSAGNTYSQTRLMYQGTLTPNVTNYNLASDGTSSYSWGVVTTSNCNPQSPFECFEIPEWSAAGTFAASTIQITSATASLTTADVWVEVYYLSSASYPIASRVTSGNTPLIPAGSSPASLGAGTWAHTSLGHDYVLTIPSFTTALAGYVRAIVKVGKPSLTVAIDPKLTIA